MFDFTESSFFVFVVRKKEEYDFLIDTLNKAAISQDVKISWFYCSRDDERTIDKMVGVRNMINENGNRYTVFKLRYDKEDNWYKMQWGGGSLEYEQDKDDQRKVIKEKESFGGEKIIFVEDLRNGKVL